MSLFRRYGDNPDGDPVEVTTAVTQTLRAMDDNRKLITRWFWKGLLAFNLVLGSVVFWVRLLHWR